jgi:type VI secretion system protein ImpH
MATARWHTGTFVVPRMPPAADDPVELAHRMQFEKLHLLLETEAFRVEFFQAVRLLERIERNRGPVGYFVAPGNEAIRFSALPTLAFPPSQLYDLNRGPDGQLRLVVQFMGISAAFTIMPHAYTEYLLLQLKNKDRAMADFYDIFNHRIISLFYRGWEKYRFFIGFESDGSAGSALEARSVEDQSNLTARMLDLIGLGTAGMQGRSVLPDAAYLSYVGLLGRHTRTAAALKQILEDYFQVSITIQQFAGTWRALPAQNRTVMEGSNRASERLGIGTVVGNEVWDHHGRIRISIGPMSFDRYVGFLPGHPAHQDLAAWVRFFSSGQYEAEVQLILHREEAPSCELGLRGQLEPRLGLSSWLKTKPLPADPGDAIFLLS